VQDSGRPEFSSNKNNPLTEVRYALLTTYYLLLTTYYLLLTTYYLLLLTEVRYAAPKLIYSPRIEIPRIDLYGLTGLADDDDEPQRR
jgi:hypothetical protein